MKLSLSLEIYCQCSFVISPTRRKRSVCKDLDIVGLGVKDRDDADALYRSTFSPT